MRRIEARDAGGKILKDIFMEDSNIAIIFDDGTYVGYEIDIEYYGDRCLKEKDIGRSEFSRATLIRAGFFTEEELAATETKEAREMAERERRSRRATYERLRAEFEGPSPA